MSGTEQQNSKKTDLGISKNLTITVCPNVIFEGNAQACMLIVRPRVAVVSLDWLGAGGLDGSAGGCRFSIFPPGGGVGAAGLAGLVG